MSGAVVSDLAITAAMLGRCGMPSEDGMVHFVEGPAVSEWDTVGALGLEAMLEVCFAPTRMIRGRVAKVRGATDEIAAFGPWMCGGVR